MSVNLMRPLVASMGHHDPLDGYVTCLQLDAMTRRGTDLDDAIADFRSMIDPGGLATGDPLGIGGLLVHAYRLAQLDRDRPLRDALLDAARTGLAHTQYAELRDAIRAFWLHGEHRRSRTYRDHQDISDVMLATSLSLDAFLVLRHHDFSAPKPG